MATTYRQSLVRFDEIEEGDTVIYRTHETWAYPKNAEGRTIYGPMITIRDESRWFYPRTKVLERAGDGWRVQARADSQDMIVTRENFWGLRKAPGRGKTGENRFENDDAVVSCQICGGSWLGNSGLTPHHGYERPGWGTQSASCPGARHEPYTIVRDPKNHVPQTGRSIIPVVIARLDEAIDRTTARMQDIASGTIDLPSSWSTAPVSPRIPLDDPKRKPIKPGDPQYANRQTTELAHENARLTMLRDDRHTLQIRYDSWRDETKANTIADRTPDERAV